MRFGPRVSVLFSTLLVAPSVLAQGAPPPAAPAPAEPPPAQPPPAAAPPAAPPAAPAPPAPAAPAEPAPPAADAAPAPPPAPQPPPPPAPAPPPATDSPKPELTPAPKPEATASASVSTGETADAGSDEAPERVNVPFTLEGRAGFLTRLSESGASFDEEQLLGGAFGLGAWIGWSDEFSFGVEADHAGLGSAHDLSGLNSIDAEYSVTSVWVGTRVFPIRRPGIDAFLSLRLGLGWQSLSATGTREQFPTTAPARVFSCSELEGPGFSLGGGIGVNLRVSRRVSFTPRLDFAGQQLSGEVLGSCAVGLGSVTAIGATFGVGYDFDLEPSEGTNQARRD